MIAFLFELLILCLALGIVYWILTLLISHFAPEPIRGTALIIVQVVIALIFLAWLLSFMGWVDSPFPRTRRPW